MFNHTLSESGTILEKVPQIIRDRVKNTIKYSDIISFENDITIGYC